MRIGRGRGGAARVNFDTCCIAPSATHIFCVAQSPTLYYTDMFACAEKLAWTTTSFALDFGKKWQNYND